MWHILFEVRNQFEKGCKVLLTQSENDSMILTIDINTLLANYTVLDSSLSNDDLSHRRFFTFGYSKAHGGTENEGFYIRFSLSIEEVSIFCFGKFFQ